MDIRLTNRVKGTYEIKPKRTKNMIAIFKSAKQYPAR